MHWSKTPGELASFRHPHFTSQLVLRAEITEIDREADGQDDRCEYESGDHQRQARRE